MGCAHAVETVAHVPIASHENYANLYMMLISNAHICKDTFNMVFAECIDAFIYTNQQHYAQFRKISAEQYLRNHLVHPIEGESASVDLYYNRMLDAKKKLLRHYLM